MNAVISELNAIQAEIDKILLPFQNALKEVTAFDREIKRLLQETNLVDVIGDATRQNDNLYCYPCIEPPRNLALADKLDIVLDYIIDTIQDDACVDMEEGETHNTIH